jgi:hypothetical protein
MIQLTPQMRLLVAIAPADFRRGIDGLVRVCRESLGADPFSGTVFVFRNRRGTAIKILAYDGQGLEPLPSLARANNSASSAIASRGRSSRNRRPPANSCVT